MLQKLSIKNIALIDSAEIDFTKGLNVLSGETGSGKSVILESLNFVLGAKADKSLIRNGQSECFVKAEFDVSNNSTIFDVYKEFDIEEDDVLIVSRKFNLDGKSVIKVNGNTVTVTMLKKFTALLVDVHGQSEHFHLLKTANQLALLDDFGVEDILPLKVLLKEKFVDYKNVLKELDKLGGDESRVLIRLDVLNYQINEIENADIKANEESELLEIRQKLMNQAKIADALNCVRSVVLDDGGVSDNLNFALKSLGTVNTYSEEYSKLFDRLSDVLSEIDDVASSAENELENLEFGKYDADTVEERLEVIKAIKKKYGNSVEEICEFLENAKKERDKLENFNETSERLIKEKAIKEQEIYDLYLQLSELRRQYSKVFSNNVLSELKELGMAKSDFSISFNDNPTLSECTFESANGFDDVEFMFTANYGQPLKPLSFVISGGEMSRFMLSVKVQSAKFNNISTYVFDEIDAGISGKTASIVAEKFARISKDVQVIAITHLPQISAMADNNLLICKTETENDTITEVKTLTENDKVNEIVRLVGGSVDSEFAVKHAVDMIQTAENYKKTI